MYYKNSKTKLYNQFTLLTTHCNAVCFTAILSAEFIQTKPVSFIPVS